MSNSKFNIAVLIDGDNAQAKLIKEIIEEVSIYGKATIRRIYGDWTNPHMNSWKEKINQYSISPIQKFTYTSGKNSTDSSLIIDAMDILYAGNIDGFCIVSSDSDYTGLAKRIREEGLFVMGIGKSTTPIAFVNSCEIFTFTENLIAEDKALVKEEDTAPKKEKKPKTSASGKARAAKNKEKPKTETEKTQPEESSPKSQDLDISLIDRAFKISANEDDQALVSQVGVNLRKIEPSFDSRTYGFKTLTKLFATLEKYTVIKNEVNGLSQPIVKLK